MITAEIYTTRRKKLTAVIGADPIIITAFASMQQTNDSAAPFVQESNFHWLTGIDEPNWKLVHYAESSWLVKPTKSEIHTIFDGGMSAAVASSISGIADVLSESEYKELLDTIAQQHTTVRTLLRHPHSNDYDFVLNPALQKLHSQLQRVFSEVIDCRKELSQLKAIKSDEEIELMQRAIDITIDGFEKVYSSLQSAAHEYEVEASLTHSFRAAGASGHAYEPIVGTGKNACTLHYVANNDALPSSGMVLIDAGAKLRGYSADITRTYAIGTPSQRERAIHAAVEQAHKAIIALIRPGVTVESYQTNVDTIMKQALKDVGLLNKPADYRTYFPHAVSHGLGIDVHDSLGGYESFQPGMVLTVEPGIYIPEEGIGVRIEDDILVTVDGNKNLSEALPTSL